MSQIISTQKLLENFNEFCFTFFDEEDTNMDEIMSESALIIRKLISFIFIYIPYCTYNLLRQNGGSINIASQVSGTNHMKMDALSQQEYNFKSGETYSYLVYEPESESNFENNENDNEEIYSSIMDKFLMKIRRISDAMSNNGLKNPLHNSKNILRKDE